MFANNKRRRMATSMTSNLMLTVTIFLLCGTYNFVLASQRDSSGSKDNNPSAYGKNAIDLDAFKIGPYFDKAASKNITALLGKTAYLNCRVKNLGNKTSLLQVSWVRHRDIHLLTVGRYTYTSDQRFRAIHHPHSEDWILQIKYPQHRDSGIYECQVSTTPHMSHYIHLNVVEPSTEIIGAPDMYIETGSTINLTCVIENSPEPPAYIFWNHNNAIVTYDSPRGGIRVTTRKEEASTSFLLIENAQPTDSGIYQCNPSNAKVKSVTVHVLNGVSHSVSRENPNSNAVRGSASSAVRNSLSSVSIYLLATILINILFIQCSFWFRLFEWRRYDGLMQIITFNVLNPMATIIQTLADITNNLDQYYFELIARLHLCTRTLSKEILLNYFSVVFIGISNLIIYLVCLLFVQNDLFGVTPVLSFSSFTNEAKTRTTTATATTTTTTTTTILTKKPNFELITTQFHHWLEQCTQMLNPIFADNDYTDHTKHTENNSHFNFKGVIDNKFNLDYKKSFFRAANHLTESQTHSTNQL